MSIWQKIKQLWLDWLEEQKRYNLELAEKAKKGQIKSDSLFDNRMNPATGLRMRGGVDSGGNHYGYSSDDD